ncbi:AT-rich interactive domain-containing protein 2 [Camellia lanceoleosa]|uniref:AT-rich interactive domain-containing protein 2 n=1 Tax=Camellia lanceoleosa TaxID=1840588 RepID=A0ACC0F824_9ERIC|nr:AT-rich interactive domain-containing protein 2 [Camellia lanceoleosa]
MGRVSTKAVENELVDAKADDFINRFRQQLKLQRLDQTTDLSLHQFDLVPAFWKWRFNEMGQDVSKLRNLKEQKKFDSVVKTNPISQGKSFLKPALECLPSQQKETRVSYYFNVYVPRRMRIHTRAGCKIIDTDDDEADEALHSKSSRKRCRADSVTSSSSKYVKTRYLTGRR